MRRKICVLIVLGLLALTGRAFSASQPLEIWKWQKSIQVDETLRFNTVEMDPEVRTKAQFGLEDLRIVDGQNRPVPYILQDAATVVDPLGEACRFSLELSFQRRQETFFDFKGEEKPGTDLVLNRLNADISTESDYYKPIHVFGSYDGVRWEQLSDDSFYRVGRNEKRSIDLGTERRYTHYRIGIPKNAENIGIVGLSGDRLQAMKDVRLNNRIFTEKKLQRKEDGKQTILRFSGLDNLPIRTITVNGEGMYSRLCHLSVETAGGATVAVGNGYVYRSTLRVSDAAKTALQLSVDQPFHTLVLTIENGDDTPLQIHSVDAAYERQMLIFEPKKGETYRLQYGNPTAARPSYDIIQFRKDIESQSLGHAKLLSETAVPVSIKPEEKHSFDPKILFSGVILLVALALGALAMRGMRRIS